MLLGPQVHRPSDPQGLILLGRGETRDQPPPTRGLPTHRGHPVPNRGHTSGKRTTPPFSGHYDEVTGAERSGARGTGRVTGAVRSMGRALHLPFTGPARGIRKATHAHGAA